MSSNHAHEDNKHYYLRVWTDVLHIFVNWSVVDVDEWVRMQGWENDMDNSEDLLYHKSPIYWIRYLLIPDQLTSRLSREYLQALAEQILIVFHDDVPFEFPQDTDWTPYRSKVQHLLDAYGEQYSSH